MFTCPLPFSFLFSICTLFFVSPIVSCYFFNVDLSLFPFLHSLSVASLSSLRWWWSFILHLPFFLLFACDVFLRPPFNFRSSFTPSHPRCLSLSGDPSEFQTNLPPSFRVLLPSPPQRPSWQQHGAIAPPGAAHQLTHDEDDLPRVKPFTSLRKRSRAQIYIYIYICTMCPPKRVYSNPHRR